MKVPAPVAAAILITFNVASAQDGVRIELVNDSRSEEETRIRLEALLQDYDVSKWIFTREARIDEEARAPYSHPVLTLTADFDVGDDDTLLSNFVHEQLHWFEEMHPDERDAAIAELRDIYPEAPDGPPEGARDRYSTYLHLLVGFLEHEALKELIGAERATELLSARTYYTWVYRTVLDDGETIRSVAQKHGLTI